MKLAPTPYCAYCGEPVYGPPGRVRSLGPNALVAYGPEPRCFYPEAHRLASMDLMPGAWDTYVAFRRAFLGHPEVRIAVRAPWPQSSRFEYDDTVRVFVWDEDDTMTGPTWTRATFEMPVEVPRVASTMGSAYDDLEHWARISVAWWEGESVGVVNGRATVDPLRSSWTGGPR